MKNGENVDRVLKTGEGGLSTISDYLVSEVLSNIPEHIKDQLLKSAILNRFCDELLDDISLDGVKKGEQHYNGTEFIEWLRNSNMYVIDLDLEGKWFRYHHLFQVLLQNQLKKQHSEEDNINMVN